MPLPDLASKTTHWTTMRAPLWAPSEDSVPWRSWSNSVRAAAIAAWAGPLPPVLKPHWTVKWARTKIRSYWASGIVCNSISHSLINTGTNPLTPNFPHLWAQGGLIRAGAPSAVKDRLLMTPWGPRLLYGPVQFDHSFYPCLLSNSYLLGWVCREDH